MNNLSNPKLHNHTFLSEHPHAEFIYAIKCKSVLKVITSFNGVHKCHLQICFNPKRGATVPEMTGNSAETNAFLNISNYAKWTVLK